MPIHTARLDLVPATTGILRAALESDAELSKALGATLPASWPPEFYDNDALRFSLDRAEAATEAGWGSYVFVRRADRVLVGFGGYYGPPGGDGTVGLGYSIVEVEQGKGYATEAAGGLVARAFADARVQRVTGDTLPDRGPSIRVLEKLGFERSGPADASGVLHYVRRRGEGEPTT